MRLACLLSWAGEGGSPGCSTPWLDDMSGVSRLSPRPSCRVASRMASMLDVSRSSASPKPFSSCSDAPGALARASDAAHSETFRKIHQSCLDILLFCENCTYTASNTTSDRAPVERKTVR